MNQLSDENDEIFFKASRKIWPQRLSRIIKKIWSFPYDSSFLNNWKKIPSNIRKSERGYGVFFIDIRSGSIVVDCISMETTAVMKWLIRS